MEKRESGKGRSSGGAKGKDASFEKKNLAAVPEGEMNWTKPVEDKPKADFHARSAEPVWAKYIDSRLRQFCTR